MGKDTNYGREHSQRFAQLPFYNRTHSSFWHMSRFAYVISPHILHRLPRQSQGANTTHQQNRPPVTELTAS